MSRLPSLVAFLFFVAQVPPALAQPPAEDEDVLDEELGEEGEETPELREPNFEPMDLPLAQEEEEEAADDDIPSPGDANAALDESAPPSGDPTRVSWTAPQAVLTLHGYFRVRSELWDTFWLGRSPLPPNLTDPPFDRFIPLEHGVVPPGGCGDTYETTPVTACSTETIGFANMRLRLQPTLALSDDVRVHMMFDVFDNLVLGSTPDGLVATPSATGFSRARNPRVALDAFSATQVPPQRYVNSLSDSIVARRAWAEVTNRGLGQLRFGRMPSHWGLGLLANGGDGIDADFSSDVDRIMGITKLAGFYLVAAWDFASEGFIQNNRLDPLALDYDAAQDDDVDQFVFAAARRMDGEDQTAALQRGEMVLNYGAYFVYRNQLLSTQGVVDPFGSTSSAATGLVRRDAEAFIPDLWVQFLWRSLRIELEAVMIAGTIQNTGEIDFTLEDYNLLQLGVALESEYRLLDDKLGIYFNAGFATGDADVEGLAGAAGLAAQASPDDTISTFRFHPNYRVDLILWRNIMQQVAGAYYFRPGVSYDFIRNSFGQLFGLRADLIWSRASSPVQTWGNDPDLGVEINAQLYYRSEDGPDLLDGFYGSVQYGILFPMKGLGYLENPDGNGDRGPNPELSNAQTLRLVLGVQY